MIMALYLRVYILSVSFSVGFLKLLMETLIWPCRCVWHGSFAHNIILDVIDAVLLGKVELLLVLTPNELYEW